MNLNIKRIDCENEFIHVLISFDKCPLVIVKCERFILMSDLLREYAEWGDFDVNRLSHCYMGQVILEAKEKPTRII